MLTLLLLCLPAGGLEDDIKALALTLARPDPFKAEADRVRAGLTAANARVPATYKAFRGGKIDVKALLSAVTGLDANRVRPKVTPNVRRTIKGDGYEVRMITFPSDHGLTVTANLYAPAKPRDRMPGMILVHSHHNPKAEGELQDMGVMWARAGCYVLSMDQLGHGERRQHPFATATDYPKSFRPSRQDYYFRHNVAIQLQTAGATLIGWMAADISAGVSLLLGLPGTDPGKIAVLGSVAGGGDPAAVAAAMDDRIKAAVVFNFGGPQPETRFPLPPDAGRTFNYAGGGSWETTRNLALSAKVDALPWLIVAGIAPRRLVYAHEFAWNGDRDPVWKMLREVYASEPGNLRAVHGSGSVRGRPPESTHCNNIGRIHRKGIHEAFKEWWGIEAVEPGDWKRHPSTDLRCLGAKESIAPARVQARVLAKKRGAPADLKGMRAAWAAALGGVDLPKVEPLTWAGEKALKAALPEGGHVTLLLPAEKGKRPLTVLFGQGGAKELLAKRAVEVAALLGKGEAVAAVDLGGTADAPPGGRGRNSGATSLAASALMIGQPLLGQRVRTLRLALAGLRDRKEIDAAKVRLWGDSSQGPNATAEVVPLELNQPPHSEPVGAHVALLAALFDDGVTEVRARGGLVNWLTLLDGVAVYFPYDNVVPGALGCGDWPALCAALARPVRLEGLVDSRNRSVPIEKAKRLYAGAKNVTIAD